MNVHYDTRPALPANRDMGIGIIGCGDIARGAHLPAYRKHGLRVTAAASRRRESAAALAAQFGIPTVHADWRDLVADPSVAIVDVTVPHDAERLEVVAAAAATGKHVLMQKPMAHSLEAAQEMVALAAAGGVQLAVNQNARWCPQYRAAHLAIARGDIGAPVVVTHQMRNSQDSQTFRSAWMQEAERFQLMEYTVHHLDLLRFWTGREPTALRAAIVRKPGQRRQADMIVSVLLQFGDDLLASVTDDNATHPSSPPVSEFRIDGTTGVIDGRVMQEPMFAIRGERFGESRVEPTLAGSWFPDGFAGTMGELMLAIEEGRESRISGRDNVQTLRLVFDAYAAAAAMTPELR